MEDTLLKHNPTLSHITDAALHVFSHCSIYSLYCLQEWPFEQFSQQWYNEQNTTNQLHLASALGSNFLNEISTLKMRQLDTVKQR